MSELLIREASKAGSRDQGPLDESCFQLIVKEEVITLRSNSASEKRQWMNQIGEAIKRHYVRMKNTDPKTTKNHDTIGTLKLSLLETRNLSHLERSSRHEIFSLLHLEEQIVKSQKKDLSKAFNQAIMFSVSSLDSELKIAIYKHSEYSSDCKDDLT